MKKVLHVCHTKEESILKYKESLEELTVVNTSKAQYTIETPNVMHFFIHQESLDKVRGLVFDLVFLDEEVVIGPEAYNILKPQEES